MCTVIHFQCTSLAKSYVQTILEVGQNVDFYCLKMVKNKHFGGHIKSHESQRKIMHTQFFLGSQLSFETYFAPPLIVNWQSIRNSTFSLL